MDRNSNSETDSVQNENSCNLGMYVCILEYESNWMKIYVAYMMFLKGLNICIDYWCDVCSLVFWSPYRISNAYLGDVEVMLYCGCKADPINIGLSA